MALLNPFLGPICRPVPPGTLPRRRLGPGVPVVPGGPRLVAPGANPTNPNFQARPSAAPRTPNQVPNLTKSATRSAVVLSEISPEDSFLPICLNLHFGSVLKCD